MASGITFGGLASGLDTNTIIEKLVAVERQPINTLQQQRAAEASRKTLIGDIITKLGTLSTSFSAMNTQAGVQGRSVDVPTGAPYSAQVAGGAPLGTYAIQVMQLASAQRTYSNTVADPAATGGLAAGRVNISIGAASGFIDIDASDSLNSVANKLNGSGMRLGASVVYDGTNYRLVVNGLDTGSANAITFSGAGATGLGLDVGANTVVAAQNAQLRIDGLSVTSSTNTLSGSIPGVTLTLKGTSAGPVSMSVTQDPEKLKTALKTMVEAYNATMGVINKQFSDGKSQLGPETLSGDSVARQLQSALMGMPTVRGGPAGNTFGSLVEIGVSVDRYGTMSLDEGRLQTALNRDAAAVNKLLAGSNATDGLMKKLGDSLKLFTDFVDGSLPNKQKSIDTRISNIDKDIARMEAAATAYEQNLRQQFLQMEQLISSFQSQTSALTAQLTTGSGK